MKWVCQCFSYIFILIHRQNSYILMYMNLCRVHVLTYNILMYMNLCRQIWRWGKLYPSWGNREAMITSYRSNSWCFQAIIKLWKLHWTQIIVTVWNDEGEKKNSRMFGPYMCQEMWVPCTCVRTMGTFKRFLSRVAEDVSANLIVLIRSISTHVTHILALERIGSGHEWTTLSVLNYLV